jgi:GDPmannose 4,6-dehydratase
MFAVNSISFNHEGRGRSEHFVTRKITRAATRIKLGLQEKLTLGNLEAKRDWCDARDIARGQMMMLDSDVPDDYVLCSGKSRSVKEFADIVFSKLNLDYKKYVEVSENHFRPSEVDHLCGDYAKINKALGWEPLISFDRMVEEMIDHDLKLAQQEQILAQNGFKYTL